MTASGHTPAVALTLGEAPLSQVKPKKRDEELTLASKVGLPEGAILRGGLERPGVVGPKSTGSSSSAVASLRSAVWSPPIDWPPAELLRRGDLRLR